MRRPHLLSATFVSRLLVFDKSATRTPGKYQRCGGDLVGIRRPQFVIGVDVHFVDGFSVLSLSRCRYAAMNAPSGAYSAYPEVATHGGPVAESFRDAAGPRESMPGHTQVLPIWKKSAKWA